MKGKEKGKKKSGPYGLGRAWVEEPTGSAPLVNLDGRQEPGNEEKRRGNAGK